MDNSQAPMLSNIIFGAIVHAAWKSMSKRSLANGTMDYLVEEGAILKIPFIITVIEFADDCVLFAESENELQQMVNIFHVLTARGQEISINKTRLWLCKERAQLFC